MTRLFALDQNFPAPIVDVLSEFQTDARLVPVAHIDDRMSELDDWEILLALHHHAEPWDGLITTDTSMLNQPLELSVLIQTRLTLVAIQEAGHNPVKASGLLFAYLPGICRRTTPARPQLWKPSAANRAAEAPWEQLARVAEHRHATARGLLDAHRLNEAGLASDPLMRT